MSSATAGISRTMPGFQFADDGISPTSIEQQTAVPIFLYHRDDKATGDLNKAVEIGHIAQLRAFEAKIDASKNGVISQVVQTFFENGGERCYLVPMSEPALTCDYLAPYLNEARDATLLCHPLMLSYTGELWAREWKTILAVCKKYKRLFALIDLPREAHEANTFLTELNDLGEDDTFGFGATYWPHIKNESGDVVPSSGAIAAAIQKTDRDRGIWKAPANVILTNAYDAAGDAMSNSQLFKETGQALGVNAIRVFPGRGVKIWGCRTLLSDMDKHRSFVQSSRMLTYVQRNVEQLCEFAMYEPNNEITWMKLHNIIYSWLQALWLKGGLVGAEERQAFSVLVGRNESMTDKEINDGILNAHISFALHQPLQFINLRIRMMGGDLFVTNAPGDEGAKQ